MIKSAGQSPPIPWCGTRNTTLETPVLPPAETELLKEADKLLRSEASFTCLRLLLCKQGDYMSCRPVQPLCIFPSARTQA